MKITAIRRQIKSQDRVSIFIDGKYSFGLNETQLVNLGLSVGDEIDQAKVEMLKGEASFGLLFEKVVSWALRRHHSAKEINTYISKKSDVKDVKKKLFEGLAKHGFIDDQRFAEAWVRSRRNRGSSRFVIKGELLKKGVDEEIIESVLSEGEDEQTALRTLIEKKKNQTRYKDKQKLMTYLAGKGYRYPDIKEALEDY